VPRDRDKKTQVVAAQREVRQEGCARDRPPIDADHEQHRDVAAEREAEQLKTRATSSNEPVTTSAVTAAPATIAQTTVGPA